MLILPRTHFEKRLGESEDQTDRGLALVLEAAVADHPSEPQDREAVAGGLGIREGGHDRVRRKSQGSRTGLAREGRAGGKSPRGKRDPD